MSAKSTANAALEVNFDGLVGPTHSYAGLSWGNIASAKHRQQTADPRAAALQGLDKMGYLMRLGLHQGLLPPHERPHIPTLRRLGFTGKDADILTKVARREPRLLAATSSASAMWTANAATVSASADTGDGRVHLSTANLNAKLHRSIEHPVTTRILKSIFADPDLFCVHDALPDCPHFGDEGAANHTRLCSEYGAAGVELYTYGHIAFDDAAQKPRLFPARQSLEASRAVARRHGLPEERCVFVQQNPAVIDKGVFHNDVIAVGNRNLLMYHEDAFLDADVMLSSLREKLGDTQLIPLCITRRQLSVEEAVSSYLFNSQLISLADDRMALIVPIECQQSPATATLLGDIVDDPGNPITHVEFLDLRQSMQNGGGPACLRLRVVLTADELASVRHCLIRPGMLEILTDWVHRHYRDRLSAEELSDPALLEESRSALDELTTLLGMGPVYDFQR